MLIIITLFGIELSPAPSVKQRILSKNMNVRMNGLSIHKAPKTPPCSYTPRSENSFP